jgi:hypothetical protein
MVGFEKVSFAEMILCHFKSHVLNEIVDSALSECHNQIYDECETNGAECREQAGDGNSEVRYTANGCMK